MAKFAYYLISAVRYSNSYGGKHISHLRVHADVDSSVVPAALQTKDEVVSSIKRGFTFMTVYKNNNSQWTMVEHVRVVTISYRDYLRTDANNIEEDNLGELPEF